MENTSGDLLLNLFKEVYGYTPEGGCPITALKEIYEVQMQPYLRLGVGDALVLAMYEVSGLPFPTDGDPIVYFLQGITPSVGGRLVDFDGNKLIDFDGNYLEAV